MDAGVSLETQNLKCVPSWEELAGTVATRCRGRDSCGTGRPWKPPCRAHWPLTNHFPLVALALMLPCQTKPIFMRILIYFLMRRHIIVTGLTTVHLIYEPLVRCS